MSVSSDSVPKSPSVKKSVSTFIEGGMSGESEDTCIHAVVVPKGSSQNKVMDRFLAGDTIADMSDGFKVKWTKVRKVKNCPFCQGLAEHEYTEDASE